MSAVLLRTLTKKSKMRFGKYPDLTVLELLNMHKTKYLRQCYYALSNISFTDDILSEIYVSEEMRIKKPGKDLKMMDDVNDFIEKNTAGLVKYINNRKYKKVKKKEAFITELKQMPPKIILRSQNQK